ncbi:MAG: hypothetical protein AAF199_05395, partial [Pseudomonadota bacterium]
YVIHPLCRLGIPRKTHHRQRLKPLKLIPQPRRGKIAGLGRALSCSDHPWDSIMFGTGVVLSLMPWTGADPNAVGLMQ